MFLIINFAVVSGVQNRFGFAVQIYELNFNVQRVLINIF